MIIDITHFFFGSLLGIIAFLVTVAILFLPTIVAVSRHHKNRVPIFLLNFFLGWTFIGWVVAFIWSVKN